MQFRQQIAANKHAITGIKSRHYIAVMLNSAKTCTKRRPWAGDSFAGSSDPVFDSLRYRMDSPTEKFAVKKIRS
jgi:hypothetical protein